ncbi:cation:proton antiporter [Sulfurovum mangrovi]|uniref:cation:proton antiporter n=1 Tax=Sulfurovum mangrovi TaxID=2893889 RepID=UPI001E3F56E0|nr:cation:proton antiporter [Sulfurovum mangrovi]UFH59791.1 cation:proton antiporter [Sulfurovum mangrovi]
MNILALIVLAVALSLALNLLLKRLDVSTIVGYIFTGFIVATFFDYAKIDQHVLAELAEFGVVFLMFTIGLEFSLTHMKRMKLEVFVFGILQVTLTALLFTYLSITLFDMTMKSALVVGMALSLSSTAIVLTTLNANGDIHRPYGRYALGILLFQDVAVIPILLMVSFLAKPSDSVSDIVLGTLFSGFIVIFTLFVLGKYATTKFLGAVVDSKKQELFILAILLIVLSASLLAHVFGFSYSLGAFIAGMLIAESKYKHQIEADLVPFRDILLGLFFITVGLQINLEVVKEYFFVIAGLTVAILLLKAIIIFAITVLFSFPKRAFKTALALAQVGEFSFAVFALAKSYALVDNDVLQVLISVVVVSLVFTSLAVKHVRAFTNLFYQNPSEAMREPICSTCIEHHIMVCGYSLLGQRIVEELKSQGITYVAIEHDRSLVELGQQKGDSVFFGNAASQTLLNALGVKDAIAVIIAIDNDEKIRLICEAIHNIDERIDIILKVSDRRQIEELSDLPIKGFINQNEKVAKLLVDQALKCEMA